jgi:hypothetical protein
MKRGLTSILFALLSLTNVLCAEQAIYVTFSNGVSTITFPPVGGVPTQRVSFPTCNLAPPVCGPNTTFYSASIVNGSLSGFRQWVLGAAANQAPFKTSFIFGTDNGTNVTYKNIPILSTMHPASFPVIQLFQPFNDARTSLAFMGVTSPTVTIRSVGLNLNTFHFAGPVHNYMPYEPIEFLGGGVTRDGRLAFSVNFEPQSNQTVDNIFHYGNLSAGNLVGSPNQLLLFNATDTPTLFTVAGPADVSSVISSAAPGLSPRSGMVVDHRLMVYRTKKVSGANISSQIFLQVLNVSGNTLTPAGSRKAITPPTKSVGLAIENRQSVAIDPAGRYVLYTQFSPTCLKQVLKYQRIDPATGNKIGPAVPQVSCTDLTGKLLGVYGIDVANSQ